MIQARLRQAAALTGAIVAAMASTVVHRARAQGIDLSSGGPVEVTAAGGFEWHEAEQTITADGQARAVRGTVTVLADRLIARYRKKPATGAAATPAPASTASSSLPAGPDTGDNEVYRLEAEGSVRIVTPTDEAIADHAVYDMDQAVLVLTGHALKLTTPQQVMTARDTMEYWSQKRMAVARGAAVIVTSDAKRLAGDVIVGYMAPGATPAAETAKPVSASPPTRPADPIAASGKLERVEAFGNVEVRTTADTVRGERGVYVPDTGLARLVGHVRITHGQNQIEGPAADVNMKTGVARLAGGGGRVQGLIMPNDTRGATGPGATPKSDGPRPAAP